MSNSRDTKRSRTGSISGRLRTVSDLEDKGIIDKSQKGLLKDIIVSGDINFQSALDKFDKGDLSDMEALMRQGNSDSVDLLENLDFNFLKVAGNAAGIGDNDLHPRSNSLAFSSVQFDPLSFPPSDPVVITSTPTAAIPAASTSPYAAVGAPEVDLSAYGSHAAALQSKAPHSNALKPRSYNGKTNKDQTLSTGRNSNAANPPNAEPVINRRRQRQASFGADIFGLGSFSGGSFGGSGGVGTGSFGISGGGNGGSFGDFFMMMEQDLNQDGGKSRYSDVFNQPNLTLDSNSNNGYKHLMGDGSNGNLRDGLDMDDINFGQYDDDDTDAYYNTFDTFSAPAHTSIPTSSVSQPLVSVTTPQTTRPNKPTNTKSNNYGTNGKNHTSAAPSGPIFRASHSTGSTTYRSRALQQKAGYSDFDTQFKLQKANKADYKQTYHGNTHNNHILPTGLSPVEGNGVGYIGAYSPEARRHRIDKFFAKRQRRVWTKKVKYDVRKNFADSRVRVKGRFVKKEDEEMLRDQPAAVVSAVVL